MTKNAVKPIDSDNWNEAILHLPKPSKIKSECKRLATKIIEEDGLQEMWTVIRKHVVLMKPTRSFCVYLGNLMLTIWKILSKEQEDVEEEKWRIFETNILQEVFFNAIMIKKSLSEKFYWMIDGLREDTNKKVNHMLFRCSQPVLWRNLDVPNGVIRFAVSMVMLKLYPLQSEEKLMQGEYLDKQHKAMKDMLTDNCVDIRVEASKRILMHMSTMWVLIPKEFLKEFLAIIVDRLAYDTAIEVRVAVYEGFPYLLHCAPALNAVQHGLKCLGTHGINDKSERVRLAAFRLLSALKGHRFIKYYEVVEMEDILYRLDFEHSESVRLEIVKLLTTTFFSQQKLNMEERYNRFRHMVKISRNGALQFHHMLFAHNLIPLDAAVEHIIHLSTAVCVKLRSMIGDTSMNQSVLNASSASQIMANMRQNDNAPIAIDFSLYNESKSIIDCTIVLWTTMRKTLYLPENNKENERLNQHMGRVMMRLFDEHLRNTVLMESTLVIGSLLPERNSDFCHNLVSKTIESGDLDDDLMPHYIEAYSTWDMNKMIEIIYNGLKELKRVFEYASNRSPPKKKTKPTPEKYRRPLEFINTILASANLHSYVVQRFGEHLPHFLRKIKHCKEYIPQITYGLPNQLSEKLVILVYETYVLLSIITPSETPVNDENVNTSDILLDEINWFRENFHPDNQVFTILFLQAYCRCLMLYLESKPHCIEVFERLTDLLQLLLEHARKSEENEDLLKNLEDTAKATKEAANYALDGNGDFLINDRIIPLLEAIQI